MNSLCSMKPKVSVIIPIYNPGEALRKCVDSVLAQSYHDIEIILINDGSTDNSDILCRKFAAADKRITYIRQENAGVSAARNRGVEIAVGEYICFVDSDDYVDPDYVLSMIEAISKSEADIVIQGLKYIRNGVTEHKEIFGEGLFHVSALTDIQFDKIFSFCGPYCKLFKPDIIKRNKIYFPCELSFGEDAVFFHAYIENCRTVSLLSCTFYNYTVANPGALSTKALSPDKFWQNQSNRRGAYRRLKRTFGLIPRLSDFEQTCKLSGIGGMLVSIFKSDADDAAVCRYLDMMTGDNDFRMMDIKPSGLYHKCIFGLIKANNRLSRYILKMIFR